MKTTLSTIHLIAAGLIAGAFAIGFVSGPALASEPQIVEPFEFKFDYSASELANTEGAKQMLIRLERQIARECGVHERKPVAERKLVKACVDETMSKAVERFGSSTLAEAYRSRTGG